MQLTRIETLNVLATKFAVRWDDPDIEGAAFSYINREIAFGVMSDDILFEAICHELFELVCCEMFTRYNQRHCTGDYIFVFDHKQHTTQAALFASLLRQFLEDTCS